MSREAIKLALGNICSAKLCEINSMSSRHEMIRLMDEAIATLKQALEQPEPEPDGLSWLKKDSNYFSQPKCLPEPVGVVGTDIGGTHLMYGSQYVGKTPDKKTAIFFKDVPVGSPLYTSPPKREWQGLTNEEIDEGQRQSWVEKQAFESAAWWAEAKLKEKNT